MVMSPQVNGALRHFFPGTRESPSRRDAWCCQQSNLDTFPDQVIICYVKGNSFSSTEITLSIMGGNVVVEVALGAASLLGSVWTANKAVDKIFSAQNGGKKAVWNSIAHLVHVPYLPRCTR